MSYKDDGNWFWIAVAILVLLFAAMALVKVGFMWFAE